MDILEGPGGYRWGPGGPGLMGPSGYRRGPGGPASIPGVDKALINPKIIHQPHLRTGLPRGPKTLPRCDVIGFLAPKWKQHGTKIKSKMDINVEGQKPTN